MNSSSNNSIGSSCLTSMQLQQQTQRQQQQHQRSILHHMPPGTGRSSVFALTQMRDRPQHHHSQLGMALGSTRMEGAGGMKQQGMGASFGSGGGAAAPPGHNHGGLSDPSAGFDGDSWGVTGGGASVGGGGGGKRATSNVGKVCRGLRGCSPRVFHISGRDRHPTACCHALFDREQERNGRESANRMFMSCLLTACLDARLLAVTY